MSLYVAFDLQIFHRLFLIIFVPNFCLNEIVSETRVTKINRCLFEMEPGKSSVCSLCLLNLLNSVPYIRVTRDFFYIKSKS